MQAARYDVTTKVVYIKQLDKLTNKLKSVRIVIRSMLIETNVTTYRVFLKASRAYISHVTTSVKLASSHLRTALARVDLDSLTRYERHSVIELDAAEQTSELVTFVSRALQNKHKARNALALLFAVV